MKIYTYYDSTPMLDGQGALIKLWAQSWTDHGWEPCILHPRTAIRHRLRAKFKAECASEPSISKARIMRWLALDTVGGGWMCEYDLFNIGFTPAHARTLCRASKNWAESRWTLFHASRAGARAVVRGDMATFPAHWGVVADIGDDGGICAGLLRFSTAGVEKRYGAGVTKAQAIEEYLRAA